MNSLRRDVSQSGPVRLSRERRGVLSAIRRTAESGREGEERRRKRETAFWKMMTLWVISFFKKKIAFEALCIAEERRASRLIGFALGFSFSRLLNLDSVRERKSV